MIWGQPWPLTSLCYTQQQEASFKSFTAVSKLCWRLRQRGETAGGTWEEVWGWSHMTRTPVGGLKSYQIHDDTTKSVCSAGAGAPVLTQYNGFLHYIKTSFSTLHVARISPCGPPYSLWVWAKESNESKLANYTFPENVHKIRYTILTISSNNTTYGCSNVKQSVQYTNKSTL